MQIGSICVFGTFADGATSREEHVAVDIDFTPRAVTGDGTHGGPADGRPVYSEVNGLLVQD
jgi:hypothetical protein